MKMANIPLTVFTVIGGALAIGFGFGSQNVVNNFISGVILMVERPVKVGDFVDVDGVFGSVDEIGMRSTRIKTFGNKHMIVPNSYFLEKNVLNWTLTDHFVRLPLRVGIAYGSDTEKAKELLLHAAQACKKVLNHKEQKVYFMDFADNSLNFELLVWIHLKDVMDRVEIESELRFKIDHLFREAGIVIAFPQRDVHLMPSDQAIRVSIDQSS